MSSIYREALGSDFQRLHPQIQKRFGFDSSSRIASIGRGVMDQVWHGPLYTLPFLWVGTWRRIMFPERGHAIPFSIENYAYRDAYGRETVTWIRRFQARRPRRFDAYMIFSKQRGRIVDYLGTHQHLAVDIDLSVDDEGGLRLRSGEQRFYEWPIAFRFPLLFSGVADVRSGLTRGSVDSESRSMSATESGDPSSVIAAASMSNGNPAPPAKCRRMYALSERNGASKKAERRSGFTPAR